MKNDVKDVEARVKDLQKKYKISDADLKILRSSSRTPMLSGRVLETEKQELVRISNKKNSTQSEEIRLELKDKLDNGIEWNDIKLLKGESIKGLKTVPVRVKVDKSIANTVSKICRKNRVTISSFIRYLVVSYNKKNEGRK